MKKLLGSSLALILCMSLLVPFILSTNASSVEGLHDKMDAMCMKNNFTQEQIAEMDRQYLEYITEKFWKWELPFIKDSRRYKTESHTDEDELAYYLKVHAVDYSQAMLAVRLNTFHYANQYIEAGDFRYLFSNEEYWAAPVSLHKMQFIKDEDDDFFCATAMCTKSGEFLPYFNDKSPTLVNLNYKAWNFLQDYTKIEQLLIEKGEADVSEIKLFAVTPYMSFLYIRCDSREYLIKLHSETDTGVNVIPQIKLFKLHGINEVAEAFTSIAGQVGFVYGGGLADAMLLTKSTFDTEAESLQQDGLLNGNENGLDLLKPLSRIEAAAMLLRALNEPETAPDSSVQTFTDVPSDHWGYGAAERAYSEGLIQGVGDNQFAPDKTVAATEFATMLLRASETGEFDWAQALNILIQEGVITKENAQTMDLFTRGDMAKIIYEAKEKGLL